jgi:hypothetical protein
MGNFSHFCGICRDISGEQKSQQLPVYAGCSPIFVHYREHLWTQRRTAKVREHTRAL